MVVPRWTGKEGGGYLEFGSGLYFLTEKWGSPLGSPPRSTTEPILNVNVLCIKMSLYKDLKHSVWS